MRSVARPGLLHCFCLGIVLFALPQILEAKPDDLYYEAIRLAAQGKDVAAIERLRGGVAVVARSDPWRARMSAAAALLDMRNRQAASPIISDAEMHAVLIETYLRKRQPPRMERVWPIGLMATVLPGSGHAWLGRWHDASIAALMVWPMLFLTLWAARRRMGPVTLFFSMITLWLWSGTIFSAVSLAERGGSEAYMIWWQGLWNASGLLGRPW